MANRDREVEVCVPGLACRHCVREATRRLRDVPGVDTVVADPAASRVALTGTMTSDDVRSALARPSHVIEEAGDGAQPSRRAEEGDRMTTESYAVTGITCDHCVRAITAEVGALAGVVDVEVHPPTRLLVVTSYDRIDPEILRGAVEEAGCSLSPATRSRHGGPGASLLG